MILVCGGAGYIGSHVARELVDLGEQVLILDNLSTGHIDAASSATFVRGDLRDVAFLESVFENCKIEAVVHAATMTSASGSMAAPLDYFANNVYSLTSLLRVMRKFDCTNLVFGSSSAVYGEQQNLPITEEQQPQPGSACGASLLACEQLLHYADIAHGIKSISLRLFNVCGAHPGGELGEDHAQESHLIERIVRTALGLLPKLPVYGTDYDTPDGTCVRDYIYIGDAVNAFIMALDALLMGSNSRVYNVGTGSGCSVRQCIKAAGRVTGLPVKYELGARRDGDCGTQIASYAKITRELGWVPLYTNLEDIIRTAFTWRSAHPSGYSDIER